MTKFATKVKFSMHIDMPSRADIQRLALARRPLSVTVYLPTSHVPTDSEKNMLRARELFDTALTQIREQTDVRTARVFEGHVAELLEDPDFWLDLGRSLAIFMTEDGVTEFRLPNELEAHVSVSDRFVITPLLRATTFPQAAFVLALSQNGFRLVEVSADAPAQEIEVTSGPRDAASTVGLRSLGGRSPYGRIQGDEGRKVRLTQYARAVDHALRPLLSGYSLPLILAATEPVLSIFRQVNGYAHLATEVIAGNPDELSDQDLAAAARHILDDIYAAQLEDLKQTFRDRQQNGRAVTDLSDLARAAAFGAIETLVVDMNAEVSGSVHDDGTLELGTDHDALEEIARRALATDSTVLAVRQADLPDGVQAGAILRYAV